MKIYFAVGAREYVYLLLICGVKNILVSFAYPEGFTTRKFLNRHGVKLMVDSGAFTAWTKGKEVKIDEYIQHLEENKDIIDHTHITNLDVIKWGEKGTTPTPQDYEDGARQGWENYLYLKKKGWITMPVFHQGENLVWLEKMLQECDVVGVSHNKDLPPDKVDEWLYGCFSTIHQLKKENVKIHGFGITSPELIAKYPYNSVDSAAWALTSAFGSVLTPYGRITISEGKNPEEQAIRANELDFIENLPELKKKQVIEYIESFGFSYELARASGKGYKYRNFLNIMYFLDMEQRLNANPIIFTPQQDRMFNLLDMAKEDNKKLNDKKYELEKNSEIKTQ